MPSTVISGMILVLPKGAVPTQTLDNTVRPVINSRTDSQAARRQVTVFGKLYNISVAVCAVSLVILVVFGALFVVVQGLVSHFVGVDLWTPIADALGSLFEGLSSLFEDLAERTPEVWRRVVDGAGVLWERLWSWIEGAAGTADPGAKAPD